MLLQKFPDAFDGSPSYLSSSEKSGSQNYKFVHLMPETTMRIRQISLKLDLHENAEAEPVRMVHCSNLFGVYPTVHNRRSAIAMRAGGQIFATILCSIDAADMRRTTRPLRTPSQSSGPLHLSLYLSLKPSDSAQLVHCRVSSCRPRSAQWKQSPLAYCHSTAMGAQLPQELWVQCLQLGGLVLVRLRTAMSGRHDGRGHGEEGMYGCAEILHSNEVLSN